MLIPVGDEVGWGGGGGADLRKKNPTEAKTAHLMQNNAIFAISSMKYSFLKVLLSLKVVKFDTKMYLDEPRRGGGGDKPWSKNWDKCRMGGLTKFSPDGGSDPQFPQEKKT